MLHESNPRDQKKKDQWMPSAADHEMLRMSKKPPMPLSLRSLKGSNWTASPASRLISK